MVDRELRSSERLAHLGPEQRASWLRARVRSGELCRMCDDSSPNYPPCVACAGLSLQRRIELAAHCGDAAAALAAGMEDSRGREFQPWWSSLAEWGSMVVIRAAWAAGLICLARWEDELEKTPLALYPSTREAFAPRQSLEASETFLDCPCVGHRERCQELLPLAPLWSTNPAVAGVSAADVKVEVDTWAGVKAATHYVEDEQAVRDAISHELIRWALRES